MPGVYASRSSSPPTAARWLATPQQLLLEVTAGDVFHDEVGELAEVRRQLRWYPNEVWLWLMACEWSRASAYEPLVGRTAEVAMNSARSSLPRS